VTRCDDVRGGGSTRRRQLSIIAAACTGLLGTFAPAAAATETTAQFSVTAGSLSFVTAPTNMTLSPVTLNGKAQTTNSTMTAFSVQDATGSGAGWKVEAKGESGTGKSAVFQQYCPEAACGTIGYVTSGYTLPAGSLSLYNTTAAFKEVESTGTAPTLQCVSGCTLDGGSNTKIASAALNAGMGTWEATPWASGSLVLKTESTLKALPAHEIYRVNLLWTLATAP
jgi:hypothetical protein